MSKLLPKLPEFISSLFPFYVACTGILGLAERGGAYLVAKTKPPQRGFITSQQYSPLENNFVGRPNPPRIRRPLPGNPVVPSAAGPKGRKLEPRSHHTPPLPNPTTGPPGKGGHIGGSCHTKPPNINLPRVLEFDKTHQCLAEISPGTEIPHKAPGFTFGRDFRALRGVLLPSLPSSAVKCQLHSQLLWVNSTSLIKTQVHLLWTTASGGRGYIILYFNCLILQTFFRIAIKIGVCLQ